MLLTLGKGMELYLYIITTNMHDVSLTWSTWLMSFIRNMFLAILVMIMHEVKGNACDIIVCLLGMCEVIGLKIYIVLVDLDWCYQ